MTDKDVQVALERDRQIVNAIVHAQALYDAKSGIDRAWWIMSQYRYEIESEIQQRCEDLQEVIDDYRRLTKDLDMAINGDNAANNPSLCDIVAQVRSMRQ